jgi:hypothetical protein
MRQRAVGVAVLLPILLSIGCGSGGGLPAGGAQEDAAEGAPDLRSPPPPADAGAARDTAPVPADVLAPDLKAASDLKAVSDLAPADAEEPESDGRAEPTICVSDGSGRFVLRTSGGLDIDTSQGNDFFCPGSLGPDGTAYLNWAVPVRGNDLRASFGLTIRNFGRGVTGNGLPVELVVLIAGATGNIWNTTDLCKVDVTGNAPVAGKLHKVSGVIRCSAGIAGLRQPTLPLTIGRFEFTSGVTVE